MTSLEELEVKVLSARPGDIVVARIKKGHATLAQFEDIAARLKAKVPAGVQVAVCDEDVSIDVIREQAR